MPTGGMIRLGIVDERLTFVVFLGQAISHPHTEVCGRKTPELRNKAPLIPRATRAGRMVSRYRRACETIRGKLFILLNGASAERRSGCPKDTIRTQIT